MEEPMVALVSFCFYEAGGEENAEMEDSPLEGE